MLRSSLALLVCMVACNRPADREKAKADAAPPAKPDAAAVAPTDDASAPDVPVDAVVKVDPGKPPPLASKVLQVVMSGRVTCARRADGHVRCWGKHARGGVASAVPVDAGGLADIVAIDLVAGPSKASLVAVNRNGEVFTSELDFAKPVRVEQFAQAPVEVIDARQWGTETYALTRMGDLRILDYDGSKKVVTRDVVAINARALDGMDALHRDLHLSIFVRGKTTRIRDVMDAENLFGAHCAHRKTGTVVCWNASGKPIPWKGPQNIIDRIVKGGVACDLRSSGVACSGANDVGQLGAGTGPDRKDGKVIDLAGKVASIAAGDRSWCAVLESGELWCWGANEWGQLGDGTLIDRHRPVLIAGAASAQPLADVRGKEPVEGASLAMDWGGLPEGCKKPAAITGGDTTVTPVSAYAHARVDAMYIWFASFALEREGYRPSYPITRGDQRVIEINLRNGPRGRKTKPIDRGRYRDGARSAEIFVHSGDDRTAAPADVLVEKITPGWICGTLLDPKDPEQRTPFSARIEKSRF